MNNLRIIFKLLDTQGIDCEKALVSDNNDFEDGVMIETAIRSKMDYIVTRNIEDFKESFVPVVTPSEFITY